MSASNFIGGLFRACRKRVGRHAVILVSVFFALSLFLLIGLALSDAASTVILIVAILCSLCMISIAAMLLVESRRSEDVVMPLHALRHAALRPTRVQEHAGARKCRSQASACDLCDGGRTQLGCRLEADCADRDERTERDSGSRAAGRRLYSVRVLSMASGVTYNQFHEYMFIRGPCC